MQPSIPQAPPPGGQTSKKSGWSGCLIAALVVLGLLLLAGGVAAWSAWRWATQGSGKKVFGVVGEAMRASEEALKAPGTRELRAAGCRQAVVVDLSTLLKMGEDLGARTERKRGSAELMVYCTVGEDGSGCDQVAAVYVKALGGRAAHDFVATVGREGRKETVCSRHYSETGALLGERPADTGGEDVLDDLEPGAVRAGDDEPLIDDDEGGPAERDEGPR